MAKKIIWTLGAHYERKDILDYWTFRNQSGIFSAKLNERFQHAIEYVAKHPQTGRPTDIENIRTILIHHYLVIYEITENELFILSIWDARQDPEKLKSRLK
jgi:plasmid stabilization system protein ParE